MARTVYSLLHTNMNDYEFIFYDFEVFSQDWMVVLYLEKERKELCIRNDPEALRKFFREHTKKCIWVGWNCRSYDAYILKAILLGDNPKRVNDFIIKDGQPGWKFNEAYSHIQYINYDAMNNCRAGLKTVEGAIGNSIEETEVPFDLPRKLTPEELDMTEKYCRHDVEQTRQAFLITLLEFESDLSLIDTFHLERSENIGRTRRDLVSIILKAEKQDFHDANAMRLPSTLRLSTPAYIEAAKWFIQPGGYHGSNTVMVAGIPHNYADGGLHASRADLQAQEAFLNDCAKSHVTPSAADAEACRFHLRRPKCIIDFDVKSYYPSLMIRYNLLPRSISDKELFKRIYKDRIAFKANGDPRAKPYKIVLNSVYGAMGMEGCNLYDPRNRALVCVYGQVLITDLIEKLENGGVNGFELIQTNTDGIMFAIATPEDLKKAQLIAAEWEERTGMELETDQFDEIWQKDVNNYYVIGTTADKDGKEQLVERGRGGIIGGSYPKSNNLKILAKAMREYFLHGTTPAEFIPTDDNLIDFQNVIKVREPYAYWVHSTKTKRELMSGKVNRVFASKLYTDGTYGFAKQDDVMEGLDNIVSVKSVAKAGGVPDRAFAIRTSVRGVGRHTVDDRIDLAWYIDKANQLVNAFGGVIEDKQHARKVICSITDFM